MNVRRARLSDARAISDLSTLLTISRDSKLSSGFVEYPYLTADEFAHRITDNRYFFVAEHEGDIIGFSASYDANRLQGDDFLHDVIAQHVLRKPLPLIYCDQMGVRPSYQHRGVAKLLLHSLYEVSSSECSLWSAVASKPHANPASDAILVQHGFKRVESLDVDGGITFDIYHRPARYHARGK